MTDTADAATIDLRGLKCPLPALRTRKALSRLEPGTTLVVECTDPLAEIDIPNLVRKRIHRDVMIVRANRWSKASGSAEAARPLISGSAPT